jgi:hypothetical protein
MIMTNRRWALLTLTITLLLYGLAAWLIDMI